MVIAANSPLFSGPYDGDGVTTVFDYDFRIYANTELLVVRTNADETTDTFELATDYTVTGVGEDVGGTVVLTSAALLPVGATMTVAPNVTASQERPFSAQTSITLSQIEVALDKLTSLGRQLLSASNRSLRVAVDAADPPPLPTPVDGKVLMGNATNDGYINGPSAATIADAENIAAGAAASAVTAADAAASAAAVAAAQGVLTSDFGHVDGSTADQSAAIQAALDHAESNGIGSVTLSFPVWIANTVFIPSAVTLRNPSRFITTMLAGCGTAYASKTDDAVNPPNQSMGLHDAVIDGNSLADAYEAIRLEGADSPSILRPDIKNFVATATGLDGAGHLGNDGGDATYAGYDDATGIVMTTYKTTGGLFRRTKKWYVDNPRFDNCNRFMILTTHPDDSGSDGAGFGKLSRPDGRDCTSVGVDIRFGEGNDIDMGRLETPEKTCVALLHIGDTVTTVNNIGTDGIMFTAYVRLVEMSGAQSITQISVDGDDILSGSVAFNTDLDTTLDDIITAANAGPSSYTFDRSDRRPALWIYDDDGSKLPTGTTTIVVTTDADSVVASGNSTDTANVDYRGSGVTGLRDKFDNPEGHEGSDTIGILITDRAGAELVQPGGNGPINRIWYAPAIDDLNSDPVNGQKRTNVLRASDGMTKFGGLTAFDNDVTFNGLLLQTPAFISDSTAFTVAPVALGDWSVVYNIRSFQYFVFGPLVYVYGRMQFTPTFTTALGTLRFTLPFDARPDEASGALFGIDMSLFNFPSVPAGALGASFRVVGNQTYAQVEILNNSGSGSPVTVGNLTSGVAADIRFAGSYPRKSV